MEDIEKAIEKLKKALRTRGPIDIPPVEPEVSDPQWRPYVLRAARIVNRSIERLRAFKKAVYRKDITAPKSSYVLVHITSNIGGFVGPDGYTRFGPYSRGDVVALPKEVADILVELGKAERIQSSK